MVTVLEYTVYKNLGGVVVGKRNLEISNSEATLNQQLIPFGIQLGDELEMLRAIQRFSEDSIEAAKQRLVEFVNKNRPMLQSETCIFGTVTFEVLPRDVAIIVAFSQSKDIPLKEIAYDVPLRRNSKVSLTYATKVQGIIYMPI